MSGGAALQSSQFIFQLFMWIFRGGEASGDQPLIHPDTDSNFTQYMEKMDLKEATAYRGFTFWVFLLLSSYNAIKGRMCVYVCVCLGLLLTKPSHVKTV